MVMTLQARPVKMKWYIVISGLIFIAFLVYSSFHQSVYHYNVCMNFHGRTHCADASGPNRNAAVRSAQEIDCELVANGRDENMSCLDQPPSAVRPLSPK